MAVEVIDKTDAEKLLAGYEAHYQDNISLLNMASKGLKPEAVFDFISLADLPNNIIETALNKSLKTFQNYKTNNSLLDETTSEKLLKLFALYSKGIEVFGSVDAFSEWLTKSAYGLGNKVPQSLLGTLTGIELINEELIRIEYGDLG